MSSTNRKFIQQLKKGDVIQAHGAVFEITDDAYESNGHRPQVGHLVTAHGERIMKRPPIIQELREDPALCVVAINCIALTVAWAWLVVSVLF